MEFVDNAFDDAEAMYDAEVASYRRNICIDVFVSRAQRRLRIVDNCRGMTPDVLGRVVMRVGESGKRGASFVNGQFGFGMQAFRAACSTLTVRSRSAIEGSPELASPTAYQIRVERSKADGFVLEPLPDVATAAEPVEGSVFSAVQLGNAAAGDVGTTWLAGTGTEVVLAGFDAQWIDDSFAMAPIAAEIESHFERYAAPTVTHRCIPFIYRYTVTRISHLERYAAPTLIHVIYRYKNNSL